MKSTVNLRHILAALHCVSTEETRYYLNGVCLEIRERETFAVSTDGHALFVAHHALGADAPDNALLGQFILASASVKAIKPRLTLKPGETTVERVDASTVKLVCDKVDYFAKLINGTFPDWRRVVPSSDVDANEATASLDSMSVNSRKLEAFWRAADALDGRRNVSVPYSLCANGNAPWSVRFAGTDQAFGVIMSYRSAARRGKRPDWI